MCVRVCVFMVWLYCYANIFIYLVNDFDVDFSIGMILYKASLSTHDVDFVFIIMNFFPRKQKN